MSTDRHELTLLEHQAGPGAFGLRYISLEKFGDDWNSEPHSHRSGELFWVLRGSGEFLEDGGSHPIGAGDLVFVDALVRHTETSTGTQALEYMVLGLEELALAQGGFRILRPQEYSEEVRSCLANLRREVEQKAPRFERACCCLAELLVLRLLRTAAFAPAQALEEKTASKEAALARRYMDRHFKQPISLDTLAQVTHINKYHLGHMFSREYGISPISYLLSLRIRESQRLLRSTDHSLAQIARFTGFSSPSYFSQSFRRATGMSPAQYRARSRDPENTEGGTP